jgi:predicted RNase H-like HicB family nuclease
MREDAGQAGSPGGTFRDIPEAITQANGEQDALWQAADCLEEVIAGRIAGGREIPKASRAARFSRWMRRVRRPPESLEADRPLLKRGADLQFAIASMNRAKVLTYRSARRSVVETLACLMPSISAKRACQFIQSHFMQSGLDAGIDANAGCCRQFIL